MQWEQVFGDGFKARPDLHLLDRPAADARAGHVRAPGPLVPADGRRPGGVPQPHAAPVGRSGRRSACRPKIFGPLPARSKAGYDRFQHEVSPPAKRFRRLLAAWLLACSAMLVLVPNAATAQEEDIKNDARLEGYTNKVAIDSGDSTGADLAPARVPGDGCPRRHVQERESHAPGLSGPVSVLSLTLVPTTELLQFDTHQ